MKKKITLCVLSSLMLSYFVQAQVGIGISKLQDFSALEIVSRNKGLHLPNMITLDRDALMSNTNTIQEQASAKGLTIYNTDTDRIEYWNGSEWLGLVQSATIGDVSSNDFVLGGNPVNAALNPLTIDIPINSIDTSFLQVDNSLANKIIATSNTFSVAGTPAVAIDSVTYLNAMNGNVNLGVDGRGGIATSPATPANYSSPIGLSKNIQEDILMDLDSNSLYFYNGSFHLGINDVSVDNAVPSSNSKALSIDKTSGFVGIRKNDGLANLDINGLMAFTENSYEVDGSVGSISLISSSMGGQVRIDSLANSNLNAQYTVNIDNGVSGQQLVFINNTKQDAAIIQGTFTYTITGGSARTLVFSNGTWSATSPEQVYSSIYFGKFILPPAPTGTVNDIQGEFGRTSGSPITSLEAYNSSDWECLGMFRYAIGQIGNTNTHLRRTSMVLYYRYIGSKPANFAPRSTILYTPNYFIDVTSPVTEYPTFLINTCYTVGFNNSSPSTPTIITNLSDLNNGGDPLYVDYSGNVQGVIPTATNPFISIMASRLDDGNTGINTRTTPPIPVNVMITANN